MNPAYQMVSGYCGRRLGKVEKRQFALLHGNGMRKMIIKLKKDITENQLAAIIARVNELECEVEKMKGSSYTVLGIVGNTATSVTLYRQHTDLNIGDVIQLAPGCDQSLKICHEKFKNAARYGGHPYMPGENPVMSQLIK